MPSCHRILGALSTYRTVIRRTTVRFPKWLRRAFAGHLHGKKVSDATLSYPLGTLASRLAFDGQREYLGELLVGHHPGAVSDHPSYASLVIDRVDRRWVVAFGNPSNLRRPRSARRRLEVSALENTR